MKQASGIVPFKTLIPDSAKVHTGLFKIYQVRNLCYLELNDSMLEKPFLLVTRISRGGADGQNKTAGFAGDMQGKAELQFSAGPDNKIFLQKLHTFIKANDSSENGMWRSSDRSGLFPILHAFDVKAWSPGGGRIIDITSFINTDNEIVGLDENSRHLLGINTFFPDRSYIKKVHAFPLNIEIKTIKSYIRLKGIPATYELNLSIVMLPEKVMRPRAADRRVGYFQVLQKDFDDHPQRVNFTGMITRWRMEPKPEDVDRYLRGELVEPIKPIVFYIDPTTPKKWVPWLIKGVNDWQQAFEKAGFRNAIYAREAPLNDTTWSLEDARHNAIVYKPSEVMNANGPHISDPRSGEILESHINWYHNVLAILQEWYFIQAGAVDPQAREIPLQDSVMGKLIRFVCTHEVGHTLGLRHNFGASRAYPVDSLRNAAWVRVNGHTPSIMDYARFNYVAQPEDNIPQDDLIPRIGIYDEWAIQYGYRWYPPMTIAEEDKQLKKWVGEHISADMRLWFGSEDIAQDARAQAEDLGDDPAKAGMYGIRNLKRIMKNLIKWTAGDERYDDYSDLRNMEVGVWKQFDRYMMHAADQIGGSEITFKTRMQQGRVMNFISRDKQREALAFLNRELFITPKWLITPEIFALTGGEVASLRIGSSQRKVLNKLMSADAFIQLAFYEESFPGTAYSFTEFMNELKMYVWSELREHKPIEPGRRILQKIYIKKLGEMLEVKKELLMSNAYTSDYLSIVKGVGRELENDIRQAKTFCRDKPGLLHLEDIQGRLKTLLSQKETVQNE